MKKLIPAISVFIALLILIFSSSSKDRKKVEPSPTAVPHVTAEPSKESDLVAAFDDAIGKMGFCFYKVEYVDETGLLLIEVCMDGTAKAIEQALSEGLDETCKGWVSIRSYIFKIYTDIRNNLKSLGREDLCDSLIVELLNDDVYLRNDYTLYNVFLAVRFNDFFIDIMELKTLES